MNSGRPPPPVFTKKSVSFNAGFPNPLDWWKCQPKKMLNPPAGRRQLVLRLYTERSLPIPIPSYHQSGPFGLRCICVFEYLCRLPRQPMWCLPIGQTHAVLHRKTLPRGKVSELYIFQSYQRNFVILTSLCREERELGRQLLEWTTRVVIIFLIFDI